MRGLLDEDTEDHLSLRLNKRARKYDSEVSIGKPFFSIPRTKRQYARCRNKSDYLKNGTNTDFFTNMHNIIQNDIKHFL